MKSLIQRRKPEVVTQQMKKATTVRAQRSRIVLTMICSLWCLGVAAGMTILWDYSNRPGPASEPPTSWPDGSFIQRVPTRATLLMMVHPRCPCTRTSIRELALIMRHCRETVSTHVLFYKPVATTDDWEKTDLWNSAVAIPNVEVHTDINGEEARLFGGATSGAVVVYDADGSLVFNGGVTGGRGHSGDNAGRSSIMSLLAGDRPVQRETFVYGCEFFNTANGEAELSCCKENG